MKHTAAQPKKSTGLKFLIPVATLLTAVALTAGSGASFVSNSVNPANSYATGTLTQSNSKANTAIFSSSNLKPGDSVLGTVTITNSGSLPAGFSLTETATNGFVTKGNLTLSIATAANPGTPVWSGTFGTTGNIALGEFAAGEARTYVFTVTLAQAATNAEQGKTASASYSWDAVQTAASTYNQ